LAIDTGSAARLFSARRLLLLGRRRRLALELGVGALDRLLYELAVERAVDDDRPAALELDQRAGGARLVDVLLGETHGRRAVGVAVELAVQLLGLRVGRATPLAGRAFPRRP
jgi:hypothetical protein